MIRVRTGSRLHFGFFHLPGEQEEHWPNQEGDFTLPRRQFGGVGLMVKKPAIQVCFEPGKEWEAKGPLAERALVYALTLQKKLEGVVPGQILIEECPPEHMGLGVGTQLGLAVARAVTAHRPDLGTNEVARLLGRGNRSAVGVHGFGCGGFLVEGGKRQSDGLSPLLVHQSFPEDWRILIMLPAWGRGLTGAAEAEALRLLRPPGESLVDTDALCRLVLLGMLPALVERDVLAFGEALYDFNRRVGEMFRPIQRGVYAHQQSEEVVAFLRQEGIKGVGQSSWGPGLFAVGKDHERILFLADRLQERFSFKPSEVVYTKAKWHGARASLAGEGIPPSRSGYSSLS